MPVAATGGIADNEDANCATASESSRCLPPRLLAIASMVVTDEVANRLLECSR